MMEAYIEHSSSRLTEFGAKLCVQASKTLERIWLFLQDINPPNLLKILLIEEADFLTGHPTVIERLHADKYACSDTGVPFFFPLNLVKRTLLFTSIWSSSRSCAYCLPLSSLTRFLPMSELLYKPEVSSNLQKLRKTILIHRFPSRRYLKL
jgi:hypothetical protein